MTPQERWDLYESGEFRRNISIDLLDWAGYWSAPGRIDEEIEDETQRIQTREAVRIIATDISRATKITAALAISDDRIVESQTVTDAIIKAVVTTIMAQKLEWLTGIRKQEPDQGF